MVTLGSIREQVRQQADMVNSLFCSDAEINQYISSSYKELYDILIQKYGENYYVQTPYSFTTDGTNEFYDLPEDFYKLLGVDQQIGNIWVNVRQFNFNDRNQNQFNTGGSQRFRYRINGNQLWLKPLPASGQPIRVWYIPTPMDLADDADEINGVSGWEEYIVVDAAIKCKNKEESDVQVLFAMKQQLLKRIEEAAGNRDAGTPATITDVFAFGSFYRRDQDPFLIYEG